MKTVLLIVSFYIMTSCHAMAGNMHFFHISSKDGLPHQQIQALATDADGNIWIGTRNGLSRYDGYSIKPISTNKVIRVRFFIISYTSCS